MRSTPGAHLSISHHCSMNFKPVNEETMFLPPFYGPDRPQPVSSNSTRPPSYTSTGGPPSFVSSPPRSVAGDVHDTLAIPQKPHFLEVDGKKGPKKLGRKEPTLKPILEDVVPIQNNRHRQRFCWKTTIVTAILFVLVLLTVILVPLLLHKSDSSVLCQMGGFDAIETTEGAELFYADTSGRISVVLGTDSPSAFAIGSGTPYVKPGSPVQVASLVSGYPYYELVYMFYIGLNDTIQGQVAGGSALWGNTINDLDLQVSEPFFLRLCQPDSLSFQYSANNYSFYLYYTSPERKLKKYGYSSSNDSWDDLGQDFPSELAGGGVVECLFDSGIESLWNQNSGGVLEYWWRNISFSEQWASEAQGTDAALLNTNILAVSAGALVPNGRSHIFFQDSALNLHRYDCTGRGANLTIVSEAQLISMTPGTWISTWANSDDCGSEVDVYYQRDNTSDIHYQSFLDSWLSEEGRYNISTVQPDTIVPNVGTCGIDMLSIRANQNAEKEVWEGVGTPFGIAVLLLLGVLCKCWIDWQDWKGKGTVVASNAIAMEGPDIKPSDQTGPGDKYGFDLGA